MIDLDLQPKGPKEDIWDVALFSGDAKEGGFLTKEVEENPEPTKLFDIPAGHVKLNQPRPFLLQPMSLLKLSEVNRLLLPVAVLVVAFFAGSWLSLEDRAGRIVASYQEGLVRLVAAPIAIHYIVEDFDTKLAIAETGFINDIKDFIARGGSDDGKTHPVMVAIKESGESSTASAISALRPVAQSAYNFLSSLGIFISNALKDMYQSWRYFLGLDEKPAAVTPAVLSEEEKEALKAELTEEILRNLKEMGVVNDQPGDQTGIVVLPVSGSSTADEIRKKAIKDSFSDNVIISLDDDGKSGTVVPVFRDGRKGEPYMFVVTPTAN